MQFDPDYDELRERHEVVTWNESSYHGMNQVEDVLMWPVFLCLFFILFYFYLFIYLFMNLFIYLFIYLFIIIYNFIFYFLC